MKKTKAVGFYLTPQRRYLLDRISALAKQQHRSRSEVIAEALEQWIDHQPLDLVVSGDALSTQKLQ